jgi:hypothetical protein
MALIVGTLGILALGAFTWGDWYTYAADQKDHHGHAVFFSWAFLANYLDNAAQNWHSELLFGVLLVLLLRDLGAREQPADERGGT